MNIFEVIKSAFQPFLDVEKPPLHVGEAYYLWYYLIGTENTLRNDQVAYNIVQDDDLKKAIKDIMENVHLPMIKELTEFLSNEGVPLPQVTPEKPLGKDFIDIPEGARLSDEEIANQLVWATTMGIQIAVRGLTESTRADVGTMFAKYQMLQVTWALTMKQLMQKRGWLNVPPYFKSEHCRRAP